MCKKLTDEQVSKLRQPLPKEALKPHPSKSFLTTINSIYVTERLNDVFGTGAWQTECEIVENSGKMVVIKTTLIVPEYGIRYECYGGNDNVDRGDAYKGAETDAITKIGSWLGIGAEVWKNEAGKAKTTPATQPIAQPKRKVINDALLDDRTRREKMLKYLAEKMDLCIDKASFMPIMTLKEEGWEFEDHADGRLKDIWEMHLNTIR